MKQIITTFCFSVALAMTSFAQMSEGKITYSMEFSSDNPEMAMYMGMMQGSTMVMSFVPGKSRADLKMGGVGNTTVIADVKAGKSLSLINMMGQKIATESPLEEAEKTAETPKYEIEITTETKEIIGYKCTKAIMKSETGDMTIWFTKEIAADVKGQQYFDSQMPGFPMEMNTSAQEMNVSMRVTSIEKKAEKGVFELKIPEGYTVKTMDEMKNMGQ